MRTKFHLLLFLILFSYPLCTAQELFTLSGKISDSETGEDLIAASVVIENKLKGVITNSYGFYSISLPGGYYHVRFNYLGYKELIKTIHLTENLKLNIDLAPESLELEEVKISAEKDDKNITSPQIGIEKLNLKSIENIPVFFGENDILKTIQLLPGISNPAEGSTGFNVRGGSMGQNLILLDEASVYSSSHLLGFFSVFNSDALKDVTIYKGGIPASYGGRAASVLDIIMNNGNSKEFSSKGGIGLVSSRLLLEGPVVKDKISYLISGRRTYGDLIAKLLFPGDIISDDTNFYFYDLNAKLNYSINDKNRIYLSGYLGKDVFELDGNIGTNWGNKTATLRWNHLFSDRFFSNTSLIYSNYDYGFIFGQDGLNMKSGIEDFSFKEDASWYINPENTLKTGFQITWHQFSPGEITTGEDIDYEIIRKEKQGLEGSAFLENKQKITSRLSIHYGIRFSAFTQTGPGWFYEYDELNNITDSTYLASGENSEIYFSPEPRITMNYLLNNRSSLKFSYNRMSQYLHLLSNTTTGSPTDVWMPAGSNLKPLNVNHFSAGYFRNFRDNQIESSIEVYYKKIENASDYEDGADILFSEHVESQVVHGKGRSYGFEFYLKKKYGDLTGWISYSLSRTENKIKGINNYSWYPVRYDKTHDLSLVGIYRLSKRWVFSGVWTYATGNAVTFPAGKYEINGIPVPYYTERNGSRMPDYHRMDVSFTLEGKKRKKVKTAWDFSVYNLYNHKNAYIITFRERESSPGTTEAVRLSLFGIVPAITWKFEF